MQWWGEYLQTSSQTKSMNQTMRWFGLDCEYHEEIDNVEEGEGFHIIEGG